MSNTFVLFQLLLVALSRQPQDTCTACRLHQAASVRRAGLGLQLLGQEGRPSLDNEAKCSNTQ